MEEETAAGWAQFGGDGAGENGVVRASRDIGGAVCFLLFILSLFQFLSSFLLRSGPSSLFLFSGRRDGTVAAGAVEMWVGSRRHRGELGPGLLAGSAVANEVDPFGGTVLGLWLRGHEVMGSWNSWKSHGGWAL